MSKKLIMRMIENNKDYSNSEEAQEEGKALNEK